MVLFNALLHEPLLFCVSVAIGAVIFVNGWTDAPTAIVTCVSSGTLSMRRAAFMAAVFNLLGIGLSATFFPAVAATVRDTVRLPADGGRMTLFVLFGAMAVTAVWAVAAWGLGIPTSESHGLLAGLSGAAVAYGGMACVVGSAWLRVALGLVLSLFGGAAVGFPMRLLAARISVKTKKQAACGGVRMASIWGAAAMAFWHGAQDGQKFIGLWLLSSTLGGGSPSPAVPILACAVLMGAGTLVGGGRIVRTLGEQLVQTDPWDGLSADIGAAVCLFVLTVLGLPVSTTHTKAAVLMGVGAAKGRGGTDVSTASRLVAAWLLTFPVCFGLAYFGMKIMLCINGYQA